MIAPWMSLIDMKPPKPAGLRPTDVEVLDDGVRRTHAHLHQQEFQIVTVTLGDDLYPAVGNVLGVTGDVEPGRLFAHEGAVTDALDVAADDHVEAHALDRKSTRLN